MIIQELLFEAKKEVSPAIQKAFELLKKLKVKYVRNAAELESDIKNGANVNVATAKSIWNGKKGMPAGEMLFFQFQSDEPYDRDVDVLKRDAGVTPAQALAILTAAGFKHKKSLKKTFG